MGNNTRTPRELAGEVWADAGRYSRQHEEIAYDPMLHAVLDLIASVINRYCGKIIIDNELRPDLADEGCGGFISLVKIENEVRSGAEEYAKIYYDSKTISEDTLNLYIKFMHIALSRYIGFKIIPEDYWPANPF